MSLFDLLSSIIPAALQLTLAVIMLHGREYRWSPFFF
jgi:hypothetical protein